MVAAKGVETKKVLRDSQSLVLLCMAAFGTATFRFAGIQHIPALLCFIIYRVTRLFSDSICEKEKDYLTARVNKVARHTSDSEVSFYCSWQMKPIKSILKLLKSGRCIIGVMYNCSSRGEQFGKECAPKVRYFPLLRLKHLLTPVVVDL